MLDFRKELAEAPDLPLFWDRQGIVSRGETLRRADLIAGYLYGRGLREGGMVLVERTSPRRMAFIQVALAFLGATLIIVDPGRKAAAFLKHKTPMLLAETDLENITGTENFPAPATDFTACLKWSSGTTGGEPRSFAIPRSWIETRNAVLQRNLGYRPGDGHLYITSGSAVGAVPIDVDLIYLAVQQKIAIAAYDSTMRNTGAQSADLLRTFSAAVPGRVHLTLYWGPKNSPWPTRHILDLINSSTTADFAKVWRLLVGVAVPMEVGQELDARLSSGAKTTLFYGTRESSKVKFFADPSEPPQRRYQMLGRHDPSDPSYRLANDGELLMAASTVARLHETGDYAQKVEDGWCHTGDMLTIDGAGYLSYRGRKP